MMNARHMKNVPGRKTDMKDAQWIATLLRAGLLKGSFIPDKAFRELRHLTRYRKSVVHDITAQKNRIDKFLQSSGFRFTAFLSDTFGASGRNIVRHLIEHGSIDREALDKCLKTKTRNRIDEILVALNGSLSEHQRRFLNMVFRHLEDLEAHKHTVEDEITEEVLKHTPCRCCRSQHIHPRQSRKGKSHTGGTSYPPPDRPHWSWSRSGYRASAHC